MTTTWILVAHGSSAMVLEVRKNGEEIHDVKDFIHPRTAKKAIDPSIGLHEHFESNKATLPATDYSGEMESHEREAFAKKMADFLKKALAQQRYDTLILVSSRNLLGNLRKALPSEVKKIVAHELDKDLLSQNLSKAELVEKIRNDLGLTHF